MELGIVRGSDGTGAVCLRRMADGELCRRGGARTEEKFAARTGDGSAGRSRALYDGELGMRALARAGGVGGHAYAGDGRDADGSGRSGGNVHRGGDCDLDVGISEPIDPDGAESLLCNGGRWALLSRGGVGRSTYARPGSGDRVTERVDDRDCALGEIRADSELCGIHGLSFLRAYGNDNIRFSAARNPHVSKNQRCGVFRRKDYVSRAWPSGHDGAVCGDMLVGGGEHDLPVSAE